MPVDLITNLAIGSTGISSTKGNTVHTMWTLSLSEALELQTHILDVAASSDLGPVAVVVVGAAGDMLCSATMDGVKSPSTQTAHYKAVTAINFQRDTICFRHREKDGAWVLNKDGWDDHDVANAMKINPVFVSWGGGVLVFSQVHDSIIGAVGVSNRSEIQDHLLAESRPWGWSA